MTRPRDPRRPVEHPLALVHDRGGGTLGGGGLGGGTLELRPRGDVERGPGHGRQVHALRTELRERTADLQRITAEFDNYRKRVRRDRRALGEIAVANVLTGLLPVLDAITEAHRHGEVTGGLRQVAGALEAQLAALGLESFGAPGDPFDPAVHEAVSCTATDRVDHPTCTAILRPGYRVGGRLLRPAEAEVETPLVP
jgi:molecular chaperone GrpE